DDLRGILDVVVGKLGDVDEALDSRQDLDEGTEGDDLGDRSLKHVAGAIGVENPLPRVFLGLLQTERDPLAITVDVEHLDPQEIPDRNHLGRVVDVAPGELGDMDEAVDAIEIDEGTEVDDVRDPALDDLAGLEPTKNLLADLLALLLEHGATR